MKNLKTNYKFNKFNFLKYIVFKEKYSFFFFFK